MTNSITYDVETHNSDRARHYVFCFYHLSKLTGRYNRDSTAYEIEKGKKDTIAFDRYNCITNTLGFCLKLKTEDRKDKKN